MKRILAITATIFCHALQSCSITVPAVAKTEKGEVFIGSTTASLAGGSYRLLSTDGKTIQGKYNALDLSTTRVFDFTISDGRTGRVIVNAISDTSGYGVGKLSTGEQCRFMYGQQAVMMTF